jgi:hypothetical protein
MRIALSMVASKLDIPLVDAHPRRAGRQACMTVEGPRRRCARPLRFAGRALEDAAALRADPSGFIRRRHEGEEERKASSGALFNFALPLLIWRRAAIYAHNRASAERLGLAAHYASD